MTLFPDVDFRDRLHALIERRVAEAKLESAILASRARRSIAQRTRRHLEQMAVRLGAAS